jgi:hypothetical protein
MYDFLNRFLERLFQNATMLAMALPDSSRRTLCLVLPHQIHDMWQPCGDGRHTTHGWNEQELVMLLLAYNPTWEMLWHGKCMYAPTMKARFLLSGVFVCNSQN